MVKKTGNRIIFFTLLAVCFQSTAQDLQVSIQNMDRLEISQAEIGVPFLLQVVAEDFKPSEQPKGLEGSKNCSVQLYGSSQSTSYVNGKRSQSTIFQYIVQAHQKGRLELGPIMLTDQSGTELQTDIITITVGDVSQATYSGKDPYVLVTEVNSKSVYLGQKVIMTLSFGFAKGFDGLSIQNGIASGVHYGYQDNHWQTDKMVLGGKEYSIKKIDFEIYPERLGSIVIPSFVATFVSEKNANHGASNFFTVFGFAQSSQIQSHPCSFEVVTLPGEAQQKNVTAIGDFKKMSFSLEQAKGNVGEGVVAKMTVEGDGNLEVVTAPELIMPNGLTAFEGKSSIDRIDAKKTIKTFEWVLQADEPGKYQIPNQSFTYFDLNSKSCKELKSKTVRLTIEGQARQAKKSKEDRPKAKEPEPKSSAKPQAPALDEVTMVSSLNQNSSIISFIFLPAYLFSWLINLLTFIILCLFVLWLLRPHVIKEFWWQSLCYRWLFWQSLRKKDVHGVYLIFQQLAKDYEFNLQGAELKDCFDDAETFERWNNFIEILLKFNFDTKSEQSGSQSTHETELILNLAKEWFPIILSCCKSFHKKK